MSLKRILTVLFFFVYQASAQDHYFIQSHNNILPLNPAMTGCFISPAASVSYRSNRPGQYASSETLSASYHQLVRQIHGGIGAYYIYDNSGKGIAQTNSFNISYAAHFQVKDQLVLRLGAVGGYVQRNLDLRKLGYGDPYLIGYWPDYKTTMSYYDIGAGLAAYSNLFYAGAAVHHLNKPDISHFEGFKQELPIRLTLNAGIKLNLADSSKQVSLTPDILYSSQNKSDQTTISVTGKINYFLLGAGIRIENGIIAAAGFENKFMRLMYSFNAVLKGLPDQHAHEIFLGVKIQRWKIKKGTWLAANHAAF